MMMLMMMRVMMESLVLVPLVAIRMGLEHVEHIIRCVARVAH